MLNSTSTYATLQTKRTQGPHELARNTNGKLPPHPPPLPNSFIDGYESHRIKKTLMDEAISFTVFQLATLSFELSDQRIQSSQWREIC